MATTKPKKNTEQEPKSRIPEFKTIEEEAEFWDTHSTEEFADEWEEVTEPIRWIITRGGPKKRMSFTMDVDTLAELREFARSVGERPGELVWYFVQKGLVQEKARLEREKSKKGKAKKVS